MTSVSRTGEVPGRGAARVVVGVDGSPGSMRALEWAAAEARLRSAVLEVVHVDFMRHEALEVLAPHLLTEQMSVLEHAVHQAQTLEPTVEVKGRMCEPPVAQALIDGSEGAAMLVVGSRGRSGLKELTMGSVSNECAHHARCPVVIIRPMTSSGSDVMPGSEEDRRPEVGPAGAPTGPG